MGSTDAQLGSIQQQWNTYKVCLQEHWYQTRCVILEQGC